MDLIESSIGLLGEFVAGILGDGVITSLLVDGVIAGVGSVLALTANHATILYDWSA